MIQFCLNCQLIDIKTGGLLTLGPVYISSTDLTGILNALVTISLQLAEDGKRLIVESIGGPQDERAEQVNLQYLPN